MARILSMSAYEEIWRDLYMEFNNDDPEDCEDSLISQGFWTAQDVKQGIRDFVEEIRKRDYSLDEIKRAVPALADIL